MKLLKKRLRRGLLVLLIELVSMPVFPPKSAIAALSPADSSNTLPVLLAEQALDEQDLSPPLPAKQTLVVGILVNNDKTSFEGSPWALSFNLLNQHPDYQFTPVFLKRTQLQQQISKDRVDFIICDAINYLQLEKDYGILRLLTRSVLYEHSYFNFEALSIYVSNRNTRITRIKDLKHKRVAVLNNQYSVSQQFIDYFLLAYDIDPLKDIKLSYYQKLDEIFFLLDNKKVDALLIKSGSMEKQLEQENFAFPRDEQQNSFQQQLHIINPRKGWQAPFMHTSALAPEWAFAKAWYIDEELANQVAILLLSSGNDELILYHDQYRWSTAQKYSDIAQVFELAADLSNSYLDNLSSSNGPDENPLSIHKNSEYFKHKEYWIAFLSFLALTIIFILYLKSSHDMNRRLQKSKASLEQEIQDRQQAQELALTHQAELAHVARLSTMGEMASGLAHELNQPLSAIHTYVQGCIRRIDMGTDEPESIINALELTAQQANRAGEIIRRLRSFVRKSETHKSYTDINYVVNEVTHFLETQIKDQNIQLIYQMEENLPPVQADIIQLEQVLINLIKNAIESMLHAEEQILTISTKRKLPDYIEVCVIDTGQGISEDKLQRIFNPFFTTKESGMGMGLSISRSIIEAHDGKLYAQNNPDKGSRFCFTLPVKEEKNTQDDSNNQKVPVSIPNE